MEDLIDIKSVYRSTVGLFIARLLHYVLWVGFVIGLISILPLREKDVRDTFGGIMFLLFIVCIVVDRIGRKLIVRMTKFSKCFEIDHWPWLEGLEDYRRPSFFSLLFNKSKHNYGPRPNLFRLDAICDGFGYLSDTYGDKNVTKKWKALKKFLLAFFLIIMFAACFFFSFWIVLAVGREDPQFDKFFRWTLLIGGLFIATILAKAIWEFICFRGTLRWMRYRVKYQGESIMRG